MAKKGQSMNRSAEVSDCGKYRWWLRREWADGPAVCFVMLNPSTADDKQDDPTIRRCIGFAQAWGFGALEVRNLFPYRATDPKVLMTLTTKELCGNPRGIDMIVGARNFPLTIAAWGALNKRLACIREEQLFGFFKAAKFYCLGTNKDGSPKHPLYVKGDAKAIPWR